MSHCYLHAINKEETTSDEDNGGNYENNKGVDGRISSAGKGGSSGVVDKRKKELVIGCGDSDLSSMIVSNWSEGVGF